MVAADATVRAAQSRQMISRHRVLDANALASRYSRLVPHQLRGAATPRPLPRTDWPSELRSPSETLFRDGGA
eukprot:2942252-Prymnesium_polylepis.1